MTILAHFTNENFAAEVLESPTPVLVYFISAHCAPCKMVSPIVDQLAAEWGERVKVGTLDIYEAFKITLHYTVMKAPTLILFVNGQPVARVTGFMPKVTLQAKLEKMIPVGG